MRTKTETGNVSLYLFWSLLKIPRFFSITGNCKQKIWLKELKAAPALDFSYFQHVSKLVTHDRMKSLNSYEFGDFSCNINVYSPFSLVKFTSGLLRVRVKNRTSRVISRTNLRMDARLDRGGGRWYAGGEEA